ncbi:hypothetical protein [uncultured Hyphomicrobium sp.]|uniref:hypothetical protein n=1 Tax=uncultured Hyphomicrobium sp. TaxID=194373 RepID=UPI0025FB4FCB|nr:hypothetical protein [uncultured Hyphomicrobium sp.]
MRTTLLALSLSALLAAAPSAFACDGKADVENAFNEQHKAPWRTEIVSKADTGIVQTQQFDFQPPDRIYRKVTSGEDKAETIGVGQTAWTNEGAGWQEMKKGVADLVFTHLRSTLAPAKVSVEFKCLDKVTYDGKSYVGYQTVPETVEGKTLARTILIDPEKKRPAFNLIAPPDLSGEPLMKESYSYPADINIEKPL